MKDGHNEVDTGERKLIRDEENRLLAVDDNGYVSLYWYDADGNRTVKEHHGGEAVWVNSEPGGMVSGTPRRTVTPGGFITFDGTESYTEHVYIGSERVASIRRPFSTEYYADNVQHLAGVGLGSGVDYSALISRMRTSAAGACDSLGVPWGYGVVGTGGERAGRPAVRHIRMAPTSQDDDTIQPRTPQPDYSQDSVYYYHRDHLGGTMTVTDGAGAPVQQVEYTPWGEVFVELHNDNSGFTTPYLFNGKELDEETGLYYYGARYYDPKMSVWYSTDPMEMDYPWVTTYGYCLGNPIVFYDPDGNSTHTDAEGRIISVVDDYDFGVYKHNGSKEEILKIIQNSHSIMNPSCGGVKMGETYYIDEFKDPQSGEILTEYTIQFGKSFNPIIDSYHDKSLSMNLKEVAAESAGGGIFDIKNKYKNFGGLLNGKYVTSRSAGNFLAGYNAQSGTLWGCRIHFDTFQKLAGALHIEESHGKKLTNMQKASIILKGTYNSSDKSSFVPPMWGEIDYQYRMSVKGWNYGLLNSMKKK